MSIGPIRGPCSPAYNADITQSCSAISSVRPSFPRASTPRIGADAGDELRAARAGVLAIQFGERSWWMRPGKSLAMRPTLRRACGRWPRSPSGSNRRKPASQFVGVRGLRPQFQMHNRQEQARQALGARRRPRHDAGQARSLARGDDHPSADRRAPVRHAQSLVSTAGRALKSSGSPE